MTRLSGLIIAWTLVVAIAVSAKKAAGISENSPVPDGSFQTLDGAQIAVSDFRGKVVLINFWGTWCVPCLKEIPELVRLSHQFKKRGLEVVGIAVNSGRPKDIREFMAEHKMDYTILIGSLDIAKDRFHVVGFPTSMLVDRNGIIRKRYFGPQAEETLSNDVKPLL